MRSGKKILSCLAVALLMLVISVACAQSKPDYDWNAGVVRVVGEGVGKSAYKDNPGKYRLTAIKAARMDAQAKLVEYLETEVKTAAEAADTELTSYVIQTSAQGAINNATEVGEAEYNREEGTAKVVMQMPLFGGRGSVAASVFLPFKDTPKVAFPQPTNATVVNDQKYTGLIIDCSGQGVNCVMSPVIKNLNGTKIYGHQNLDYDKIIVNGMASYADSLSDQISRSRAGNNPLVIKAERMDDLNANPVVSVENADRILAANQRDKFLENCAVVFVK